MCTLTCLPEASLAAGSGRMRVVFSRDEQRTRLPAHPPALVTHGGRRALLPRDADGGGTWIAVNDAGVVFALLNLNLGRGAGLPCHSPVLHRASGAGLQPCRNPVLCDACGAGLQPCCKPVRPEAQKVGGRTRGAIIPHVLECATAAATLRSLETLDLAAFRPFRFLSFDAGAWCAETLWTGATLASTLRTLSAPLMRTSSSLGDAVVLGPRRRLFETVLGRSVTAAAQDHFHRHRWRGREAISVLMARPDARTVSITAVEVGPRAIRMEYEPV